MIVYCKKPHVELLLTTLCKGRVHLSYREWVLLQYRFYVENINKLPFFLSFYALMDTSDLCARLTSPKIAYNLNN